MAYKKNTGRPIEKTRLERCCIYLENHGYSDVAITNSPTDLKGKKDGKDVNIEIKWTSKQKYFGAATFTEWRPTLKGEQVEFIVVKGSDSEDFDSWKYYTFSSEEFSKYSTIPPFKVNFNINLADLEKGKNHPNALPMNKENLSILTSVEDMMKDENKRQLLKNFIEANKS